MEKVIAIVVTHNRLSLLTACISALKNQTKKADAILVINNGSTDNTEQWLKAQEGLQVITQNNTGSGGGFETGIKWAYKNGFSWMWCMDDDGYPKEDALEKILAPELSCSACVTVLLLIKKTKKPLCGKQKIMQPSTMWIQILLRG